MRPNIKKLLIEEVKNLFSLTPQRRHWAVPVLAALCIGAPLFIGLLLNQLSNALIISFSGLVILYIPIKSSFIDRMGKLLMCSFGFMVSYAVGLLFSFNFIISCITFGLLCGIIHYISLWLRLAPPGNFFFIMLASMGSAIPFNLALIPHHIGLVAIGTMTACTFALIYSLIQSKTSNTQLIHEKRDLSITGLKNYANHIEAVIIALFMFGAMLVGHLLEIEKPYWIPVSCIAVMQGVTIKHTWRRGLYRIAGTFMGMAFCWVILSLVNHAFVLYLVIVILQYIVEVVVTRNYALAVIFITPLTILLIEAGSPIMQHPTELIAIRMLDVLLGSIIGAIGGWFVHNEQIRHQALRRLRIAKVLFRKRKHV
ncbi:FUSC family protein [Pseudopedobacter saltans]|nr:FUSC family protein [Pseudopedobacter saltans]